MKGSGGVLTSLSFLLLRLFGFCSSGRGRRFDSLSCGPMKGSGGGLRFFFGFRLLVFGFGRREAGSFGGEISALKGPF